MTTTYTKSQVASHTTDAAGMWIIIDGDVYDVTKFKDEHPGGPKILKRVAGKDASKQFWKYHNDGVLKKYKPKLQVGTISDAKL
ncbi:putative cytochrome b5 [Trichodelitschia bisporula]|uniref:Putative cytochrome b5 n=1 Tax=Trichodelitschia bisporula TaxID=703511 RepID=A0A6G1I2A3_9PEZI|nr:putative cytochrome b5 [Trichodelitschia bisporula]